uniref:Uncharacterized protein n=1 Tax=Anguilla anguilla TaxID=7936 RepID=A0A0E9WB82_ANGAN
MLCDSICQNATSIVDSYLNIHYSTELSMSTNPKSASACVLYLL